MNVKKVVRYFAMLAIAVLLLFFAFRGVKWSDFIAGLKECNFWWIGISMLTSVGAFVVRGLRWRLIMLPVNPTIKRREAYDGVTVAYLTNFALPRAGEFARCGVIANTGKASFESILGTVVLERAIDMLSLILILTTFIILKWSMFGGFFVENLWNPVIEAQSINTIWIIVAVLIILLIIIILLRVYREKLMQLKIYRKFIDIWRGLVEGLKSGFKMKHRGAFLMYTILLWGCYWFMSLSTIYAFPTGKGLDGVDALFLMLVGSLGWVVPVQGGIGAYHFILSLALHTLYGIERTQGVIFATISHESQALTMLICGGISLLSIYLSMRKKKNKKV